MNAVVPAALVKSPQLEPAQDFYALRRQGIAFIEEMGSAKWTDFNVHDPGITILEALSYAITDLGYRIGWRIEDILAPATPSADPRVPFPGQAFFTARAILTVNPTTTGDFRRLMIDRDDIRNAWLICKECACETSYLAWCESDSLNLAYCARDGIVPPPKKVWARGLYETLLRLEDDPKLGDLSGRKVETTFMVRDGSEAHTVRMELRFPDISLSESLAWRAFLDNDAVFGNETQFTIAVTRLGATLDYDVISQAVAARDDYVRRHWNDAFFLTIQVTGSAGQVVFRNATLRVFGDAVARGGITAADLLGRVEDTNNAGLVQLYRRRAQRADDAVRDARATLQSHRNLDEDYCIVDVVGIEEIAVCADVEVEPDADIEWVQAKIWFEIEQYLDPPVRFRTLAELRANGTPVETIFNGPELGNGFIEQADLDAAALKTELRVSDILNRLMDIPGVAAVNRLLLTKYDAMGNAIKGAADPAWNNGKPVFDPAKLSAAWLLFISPRHQPKLYRSQSRFLFYKAGLPFKPRMDEALDTLNQLRGESDRPKNPNAENDLRIPAGDFRDPQGCFPIQYGFPQAYGIGREGLPSHASDARRAQARNLKAYLMVFEQLLGNAFAQLAHTADLFSLDPAIPATYFSRPFMSTEIDGYADIVASGLTQALDGLVETRAEFLDRRNGFLDHLLARFGEQFREYALLLTNAAGIPVAKQRLIDTKISFLKRYPLISHDRDRAFDYTVAPCSPDNWPGIKKRINLLLGFPDLTFVWNVSPPAGTSYPVNFHLYDQNGKEWLAGDVTATAGSDEAAIEAAYRAVIERMVRFDAWGIVAASAGKSRLVLNDMSSAEFASYPVKLDKDAAAALRDDLIAWSANERLIVVEHLLLRPKFVGDALYPACCDGGCGLCGGEDPYSFRLTFVMPGWTPQYTDNLNLRAFADRTIQQETPSHLLPKTCWVGNGGFEENPCDEIVGRLADLLIAEGATGSGVPPSSDEACACANALYHAFSTAFAAWYEDKKFQFLNETALDAMIAAQLDAAVKPANVTCTTNITDALWLKIQATMTAHFVDIALHGWQFERFERAWCEWLDANAAIDWTRERLTERVEAILSEGVTASNVKSDALCECANTIVRECGLAFRAWMDSNLENGTAPEALPTFTFLAFTLCADMTFAPETAQKIADLLNNRYRAYTPVSYWLSVVVALLAGLRNTYPGATLHDCDDGSDTNPVRLDNTALGNYPLRTHTT